ncbi:MAG TPA: GNAT family N-acetyltransferase [Terriglobales bacterium]
MLELRTYRPQDFRRLLEIDKSCFVRGIAYNEEELRYFLRLASSTTLVATDGENIQGFVIADRFRQRRSTRAMGRIITIDVAPETQHTGIGTLLLAQVEDELRQGGCDSITLEVAIDNAGALSFYKKHHYSVLKVLPRYYLDSIDGLMMGKRL